MDVATSPGKSLLVRIGVTMGAALVLVGGLSGFSAGRNGNGPAAYPRAFKHPLKVELYLSSQSGFGSPGSLESCGLSLASDPAGSAGIAVQVQAPGGVVLATASLGRDPQDPCDFEATIPVPDASAYSIGIVGVGRLIFARAALERNGWVASLAMGS